MRRPWGCGSGLVFVEGDVADPVQPVLDAPVTTNPAGELGWVGAATRCTVERLMRELGSVAPDGALNRFPIAEQSVPQGVTAA